MPCGTTGESPTLSHAEHNRVTALCVEVAKGRVPVIAGTGANNTDEAIRLIDENKEEPFLIYLPFYTVHTPLQAPKKLVEKYRRKAETVTAKQEFGPEEQVWPNAKDRRVRILQNHATYAAMVESMDASVGRVLDHLKKSGLDDNTVVCFTGDNGGLSTSEGSPTSNLPLRGGKGWVYEGGIREPFIIRAPGVAKPGAVSNEPVISTDFYPTILELAGLDHKPEKYNDGVSLVGVLKDEEGYERQLFWHYPHYSNQGGFPGGAIHDGDWKLIERYEDGRTHLYNRADDIGERNDLVSEMRDVVRSLRECLHAWYHTVDAKFLEAKTPNGSKPWRP